MSPLRLCVGSGQRPHGPGWVNCDIQSKWRDDTLSKGGWFVLADMSRLPFPSASTDIVVCHHVLEHLQCDGGDGFIRESYRVLRPGGSLIVSVPDMEELAHAWWKGFQPNGDRMSDYLFMVNTYGAYMGDPADTHKWGYSYASLKGTLAKAAHWRRVRLFDWRPIPGADLARDWWVLAVEAVK